jgi:hypothetical protein
MSAAVTNDLIYEILKQIQSHEAFSTIDHVASEAKRATDLLERLDHAALAKAFRGELAPQNETASIETHSEAIAK